MVNKRYTRKHKYKYLEATFVNVLWRRGKSQNTRWEPMPLYSPSAAKDKIRAEIVAIQCLNVTNWLPGVKDSKTDLNSPDFLAEDTR